MHADTNASEPGRECPGLLQCRVKRNNAVPRSRAKPEAVSVGQMLARRYTVAHNSDGVAEFWPEVWRSKSCESLHCELKF